MKVISLNIGEPKTLDYKGTEVVTGIFKYPVAGPIYLGESDVGNDSVVDRRFHGGTDKAVYAYGSNHYVFWKERFPLADWEQGMFGENLTLSDLDESKLFVGSIYEIGGAQVQVCQPRQPCFKLGIRFGTQSILKQFIKAPYPGVYFRVIKPGFVSLGDELVLISDHIGSPSVSEVYSLMYHKQLGAETIIQAALDCIHLPEGCKDLIRKTQ